MVFAHLGHPLLARATRLLRSAVTSIDVDLHRVTAVLSDDSMLTEPLAVSYARFVVVGGDGVRLHEEVLHAGGSVRRDGRFARIESLTRLDAQLTAALAHGHPLPAQWRHRLADGWKNTENGLFLALQQRAKDRSLSVRNLLDRRQADERRRITEDLERFAGALRGRLADADTETSEFALFAASVADPVESAQLRRDRESWRRRLASLPGELDTELRRIATRYADPGDHLFPVAVVFVVPRREVIR